MGIQTSLDAVVTAERLIDAMRASEDLAFEASREGGARTIRILTQALASADQLVAIAATHALGQVFDAQSDAVLSALLSDPRPFLREHAAWVLGGRLPRLDAVGRLLGMVVDGGFAGMLAQRTLEQWSTAASAPISVAVEAALLGVGDAAARARLVETLGLVRDRIAGSALVRVARDPTEPEASRVAAVSALGQRSDDPSVVDLLAALADTDGTVAGVARLALFDFDAGPVERGARSGTTVAQLFLHADIDAGLSQVGSGDTGGIATLLVRLGDALVRGESVDRVVTLSRGSVRDAIESVLELETALAGHVYGRIPLLSPPVASANAWPLRVAARRGIRRVLRAAGGVDMIHLRMADVGSLAAADVARELDIPVVFTVAPDPHAVIQSLDESGRLTRADFGDVDVVEHFWFRARLVERLAANSAHTVLFPRPALRDDMRQLVGIDITAHPERHTVVPEGIDLQLVDRAVTEAADHAAGRVRSERVLQLAELLAALPPHRRGLPLVLSVGRLHRVKGMATIVEAWNAALAERANLLVVGGDLLAPSADERQQLDAIDAIVPPSERLERGLLLAGHRPNDVVARWMAAARVGIPGLAAPAGVYVCGSLKEEFGIALLEAMASGLLVVAPDAGGPATYVVPGDTGFLTRTWDPVQLATAMSDALDAAAAETSDARAGRSRATVAHSFTIEAMAGSLSTVYSGVRREESRLHDVGAPTP